MCSSQSGADERFLRAPVVSSRAMRRLGVTTRELSVDGTRAAADHEVNEDTQTLFISRPEVTLSATRFKRNANAFLPNAIFDVRLRRRHEMIFKTSWKLY